MPEGLYPEMCSSGGQPNGLVKMCAGTVGPDPRDIDGASKPIPLGDGKIRAMLSCDACQYCGAEGTPQGLVAVVEGLQYGMCCNYPGGQGSGKLELVSGTLNGQYDLVLTNPAGMCQWIASNIARVRHYMYMNSGCTGYAIERTGDVNAVLTLDATGGTKTWRAELTATNFSPPGDPINLYLFYHGAAFDDCSFTTAKPFANQITSCYSLDLGRFHVANGGVMNVGYLGINTPANGLDTFAMLERCKPCEYHAESACKLLPNESGGLCPSKLAQLMSRGGPCPYPHGNRWAGLNEVPNA